MGSHQPQLPSDMIFEIITRASSLQTLDTCKAVSNEWNHLIHKPTFMDVYCNRTNNLCGYFVQDIRRCEYVTAFVSPTPPPHGSSSLVEKLSGSTRILASCKQGILISENRTGRKYQYYVCKPATQQWRALPNPKLRYMTVAVGLIVLKANPLRYKIVRLSELGVLQPGYYTYRSEIFDSKTWRWRRMQDLKLPSSEIISDRSPSICIGNSIYCLTSEGNVLTFSEHDESFHTFSLPEHVRSSYQSKRLVEYEGRLGFTVFTDDYSLELWLIKDGAKTTYDGEVEFFKVQDCLKKDELRLAHDQVFQFRSDLEQVNLDSRVC